MKRVISHILFVSVSAFFVYLGIETAKPYVLARTLQDDNAELRTRIAETRANNQRMKRDIKAIESGQGLESRARRDGYIRQGEAPLIIPPSKEAPVPAVGDRP
jgi:cell division protein FtsB